MRFDPKKRTVPLTDVELNYSPEEWAEALAEDPSCIRAYLEAAEERGRRRGVEEAARMIAREGDRNRGGDYELQLARLAGRVAALALAPRDSGKEKHEPR